MTYCSNACPTVIDAALGEIITTASKLEWILDHGERYLRPEKRSRNLILGYKDSYVHYDPLGVVAAIVSWNYRAYVLSCHTSALIVPAHSPS
jgi:acyl-CoA reductase-like NAD-dependent aldehyde dehydrogenase